MLYIKTYCSAFKFVPVGCGEVPKLVLGGNNHFQGTFLPCLFFGQKHPRLIQRILIARGRAAGTGTARTARCNTGTAQVQVLHSTALNKTQCTVIL
jgi:hypothetical protein